MKLYINHLSNKVFMSYFDAIDHEFEDNYEVHRYLFKEQSFDTMEENISEIRYKDLTQHQKEYVHYKLMVI